MSGFELKCKHQIHAGRGSYSATVDFKGGDQKTSLSYCLMTELDFFLMCVCFLDEFSFLFLLL